MDELILSEVESALVEAVAAGLPLDLDETRAADKKVRAEVVVRLMLDQALTADEYRSGAHLGRNRFGLMLSGATIVGPLTLQNARGHNGHSLPPLLLTGCAIADEIDLSWSRFMRLSFNGCRIVKLQARDLTVEHSFDLGGLSSAEFEVAFTGVDGRGACQVWLFGCVIGGDLYFNESEVVAQQVDETSATRSSMPRTYMSEGMSGSG